MVSFLLSHGGHYDGDDVVGDDDVHAHGCTCTPYIVIFMFFYCLKQF